MQSALGIESRTAIVRNGRAKTKRIVAVIAAPLGSST
jgi:hypothetical protein